MSTSFTSPTTTVLSRLSSFSTKSHLPSTNSSSTSPQYPTPPETDNTLPRGKKRKITAPSIDTSISRPRAASTKKSATTTTTRSPATATPTGGKPSTPRGRQSNQPPSATATTYPTRLSSAERNRRHIVSEEKRRKEGELERLRLSRLVPDALELDRSEEQLLETTVDFVWSLLDDRRKLVEALESRGIRIGEGEHEGGLGRDIWGNEKLMAELGDLERLRAGTTGAANGGGGGGGDDDAADATPAEDNNGSLSRPKPKRKKSKAKVPISEPPNASSVGAEASERRDTGSTVAAAETPLTNPTLFDSDFLDISSYVPMSLEDAEDDAEARAAANSLVDFPTYRRL